MTQMAGIEAGEILQGIREWVEIETPTDSPPSVNRLMDEVQSSYEALGATTRRIPRDGFGDCLRVRCPWGGDEPGILVLSHLDTVHPLGTRGRAGPTGDRTILEGRIAAVRDG